MIRSMLCGGLLLLVLSSAPTFAGPPPWYGHASQGQQEQGQDRYRLRNLRLQEAIRNGDISPDDARQSRQQEQQRWQRQQDRPAFDEGRGPSQRPPSNRWRDRLRDNYQRD